MNKKQILIDFNLLRHPNCGLGQVAINFGHEILQIDDSDIDWIFLTRKNSYLERFNSKRLKSKLYNIFTKNGVGSVDKYIDLYHITSQLHSIGAKNSRKNIYTIHDLNFLYEKSPSKAQKYLRKVQNHVNRATAITCISEFTASEVRANLSVPESTPISVIYNGVKSPDSAIAKKPLFLPEGDYIFTIGALMAKKNFHTLVAMMKFLPNLNLIIAGPKSEPYHTTIIKEIKKYGLENRIFVPGVVSEEEKAYLYHNCHAFVFPTKFEGFGLPIVEAMLCGKPTFASNLTSLPEIGKEHAYYWENFEPKYMATIFKQGIKDFESNKTERIEAMKAHGNSFSWEQNAKAYHAMYRKMLGLD